MNSPFTEDATTRKTYPVFSGLIKYFPNALARIAHVSYEGNEQHGHSDLHWDRSKSIDEPDALMRHIIDYVLSGNKKELYKVGWRALAWIEREESE